MTVATYAAAQLLRVLPRERITRAVGRLCDARAPAAVLNTVVRLYARAYRVDMDAAEALTSPYESFDAFFTRKLREGMRPVCSDPGAITSPADGRVEALGPVTEGGRLTIKGQPYRVEDLVGDPAEATRYDGGQFAIVYLSPRDYHRVHSPVAGQVSLIRSMPGGELFPVNAIGERHVPGLFARNRRVAIVIDTRAPGARYGGDGGRDDRRTDHGERRRRARRAARPAHDLAGPSGRGRRGDRQVPPRIHRGHVRGARGSAPWSRSPGPILYGEPLGGGDQR